MINYKHTVELQRGGKVVTKRCIIAQSIVANIYERRGYTRELNTVTSVMDGTHMRGSKHYDGDAFDQRTWKSVTGNQMSVAEKEDIAQEIRNILGPDWDVVVEKTHLHIEFDVIK